MEMIQPKNVVEREEKESTPKEEKAKWREYYKKKMEKKIKDKEMEMQEYLENQIRAAREEERVGVEEYLENQITAAKEVAQFEEMYDAAQWVDKERGRIQIDEYQDSRDHFAHEIIAGLQREKILEDSNNALALELRRVKEKAKRAADFHRVAHRARLLSYRTWPSAMSQSSNRTQCVLCARFFFVRPPHP